MNPSQVPELYVGIDPDLHGAIVVLNKTGEIRSITRLAIAKEQRKGKAKVVEGRRVSGRFFWTETRDWDGLRMQLAGLGRTAANIPTAFAIEKQMGFQAQSQFNILVPYGMIVGMLMMQNIRPIQVPVQTWQASCLPKRPKAPRRKKSEPKPPKETEEERRARLNANREQRKQELVRIATGIWPDHGHAGAFNSGEADAALIARWLWLKFRMAPLTADELLDVSENHHA